MNFLCPTCRTLLPLAQQGLSICTACGVQVDLTRVETDPGTARLWPEVDLTGDTVAGHVLHRRLGTGGMGTVYEATAPDGAKVAFKVLAPMLAAEPSLRERFRREAQALRRVEHPNVVRVLSDGEERGFCWYAMQLVPGEDLSGRIAKGPMPARELVVLAGELLAALAAVHGAGLVHRDVKPANILIGQGRGMLCDFGIARFDGASTLTQSAALLGSLRYMAPEQRLGRAEAASDLYALGLVLYEAAAGALPADRALPRSTPRRLRRALEALLKESPRARPVSATAAAELLEASNLPRVVLVGASVTVLGLAVASLWPGAETAAKEPPPPAAALVDARPTSVDGPAQAAFAVGAEVLDAGADAGAAAAPDAGRLEPGAPNAIVNALAVPLDAQAAPSKPFGKKPLVRPPSTAAPAPGLDVALGAAEAPAPLDAPPIKPKPVGKKPLAKLDNAGLDVGGPKAPAPLETDAPPSKPKPVGKKPLAKPDDAGLDVGAPKAPAPLDADVGTLGGKVSDNPKRKLTKKELMLQRQADPGLESKK